jgi:adenylate cyclase class IV
MSDIIDLDAVKDRRTFAEIEADQAHWESVNGQLVTIMENSGLSKMALISASLRALFDMLDHPDISRHDAKTLIAGRLKAFQE